jgi:hypothetical protein
MLSNEKFLVEKNEMLNFVGRECEVVKRNSLEWVRGVIIGVMSDKRSNCNMFRIEVCEGENKVVMNKKLGAPLFKILDSVSDREIKSRVSNIDSLSKDDIIKKIKLLESEIELLKSKLSNL